MELTDSYITYLMVNNSNTDGSCDPLISYTLLQSTNLGPSFLEKKNEKYIYSIVCYHKLLILKIYFKLVIIAPI